MEIGPANWWSYDVYDLGDGAFHRASLTIDEPFYCVWWYINGEYAGWSDGSNVKTRADFTFSGVTDGDIAGNAQTISAEVGWLEDNGDATIVPDSYTIIVWEPIFTFEVWGGSTKRNPDVSGYAELTRHYRSGNDVTMDYYLEVIYRGDEEKEFDVSTENKHTIFGLGSELGSSPSGTIDEEDNWFYDSGSITNSALAGGDSDTEYDCEAVYQDHSA